MTYVDRAGLNSPVDMETDGPLMDDNMLRKAMEEEATPVTHLRSLNNNNRVPTLPGNHGKHGIYLFIYSKSEHLEIETVVLENFIG